MIEGAVHLADIGDSSWFPNTLALQLSRRCTRLRVQLIDRSVSWRALIDRLFLITLARHETRRSGHAQKFLGTRMYMYYSMPVVET